MVGTHVIDEELGSVSIFIPDLPNTTTCQPERRPVSRMFLEQRGRPARAGSSIARVSDRSIIGKSYGRY